MKFPRNFEYLTLKSIPNFETGSVLSYKPTLPENVVSLISLSFSTLKLNRNVPLVYLQTIGSCARRNQKENSRN
jgi:hypothetical protein